MWKNLKVLFLLLVFCLPVCLFAQSVIGLETGQATSCETKLLNCNQVLKNQYNENNLQLTLLTTLKTNSTNQINTLNSFKLKIDNLQMQLTASSQTVQNLLQQNNLLTQDSQKLLDELNSNKNNLQTIQTDFDTYKKDADAQISKWRGRAIWTFIGAGVLTALVIIRK